MSAAIPLRRSDGSVRAWAAVDVADHDELMRFRWRVVGDRYVGRCVGHGYELLHRRLLGLIPGDGLEGDHIDRDPLNNRRLNLRVVTHAGNCQNVSNYGVSAHRGVSWHRSKGRWQVQVRVNGERAHLGYFTYELEAAEVAAAWRRDHMPYSEEARA